MRPSAPLLRVRELSITHADATHPSPDGASFDIHHGEVVLLLGPSGSGKSTLTLALNGLIPHAIPGVMTGTVVAGGLDTATTSTARLSTQVGMVFQDPDAQIVTATVYDEGAFGPENLLLPVADVERRTEHALRRTGLWERRAENPDVLSGGGRQRLAIACALALDSPLIVLDEPTANLDPQGIDDVYAALEDVVASGEHAILLVEHNLDAAMDFVTRTIVLDDGGRVAFDGPVAEVLRAHTDELVTMGVWLPTASLAALRLREVGIHLEPLPLTPGQLRAGLDALPALPNVGAPPAEVSDDAPSVIRTTGLRVQRRGRDVLRGIDLEIPAGSLTAIVGANGAGKTTLIQALAGVVPPPRGQVLVDGLDAGRASPRELAARIGFVFQNPEHQFIAATVFDELAHGLRLRRVPDAEITERVGEMLRRFGLEAKSGIHPFLLSGGEKRRLSVGTALITRPRVLALDEPTFGQDRARATEMLDLLGRLRDEGTTILLVTHDLQLVADHTTHTVILADGRVRAAGRTAELFGDEAAFAAAGLRLPTLHRMLPAALRGRIGGA